MMRTVGHSHRRAPQQCGAPLDQVAILGRMGIIVGRIYQRGFSLFLRRLSARQLCL
jgi:hypothetical protein